MADFWKVLDYNHNLHTDGLSFEEAVDLAKELSEDFGEDYVAHPDPDYRGDEPEKVYNTRGQADGWEDLYNY